MKNHLLIFRSLIVMLTILSLSACTSTHFVSTWQDPDAAFGKLDGEKVAAFLISEDESARRGVEEALANELTARGAQGVAGFTLLSSDSAKDKAVAVSKLKEASVQAVVTMRIVSESQQTTTTPATWHSVPAYRLWGDYWVRGWRTTYTPGQNRTDTVVQVETLIYDLVSEKLIWAGLSKTTNPGQVDDFVKELALAVDGAVKKTGLLR